MRRLLIGECRRTGFIHRLWADSQLTPGSHGGIGPQPVDESVETVDSKDIAAEESMRGRPCHASMVGMSDGDVQQIEVGQLPAEFGADAVLLDVREDDEWQSGHIVGAQHIPMGDVPVRIDEIDRDATLYVICHAGGRSQRVAQYLARNGFDPINVSGGMLSWVQAGRPVSSGS